MPDYNVFQGIVIVEGTHSHGNNTNEQDVIEIIANVKNVEVSLDMINLVQNTTIRVYEKVDGSTYRSMSQKVFPTDFPTNAKVVVINLNGKEIDQKITFQSGTVEGSTKNVPHARVEEIRT